MFWILIWIFRVCFVIVGLVDGCLFLIDLIFALVCCSGVCGYCFECLWCLDFGLLCLWVYLLIFMFVFVKYVVLIFLFCFMLLIMCVVILLVSFIFGLCGYGYVLNLVAFFVTACLWVVYFVLSFDFGCDVFVSVFGCFVCFNFVVLFVALLAWLFVYLCFYVLFCVNFDLMFLICVFSWLIGICGFGLMNLLFYLFWLFVWLGCYDRYDYFYVWLICVLVVYFWFIALYFNDFVVWICC